VAPEGAGQRESTELQVDPATERIRRDLERHLRQVDGAWTVHDIGPLPYGHSGFTYEVHAHDGAGSRRLVLRVPPPGARPLGPADVVRQGRIVEALRRLNYPVPAVVATSDDAVVDGRPFVLFELIPGWRIEEVEGRVDDERLIANAVETLLSLHRVPVEEVGLDEEPAGVAGELERWQGLFERARTDPGFPHELLRRALAGSLPESAGRPCLVHGDFHCGNLLFDADGGVVAVVDWEIAELGQALVDLGCLAVPAMSREDEADGTGPVPGPAVEPERLARLYGANPSEFSWYCALTCYKYAAVYAYNLMLHRRGKRVDPFNEGLEPQIGRLLRRGLSLVGE
jgi:aminoglycoside phosphotransferase (APT) family kinase protein